MKGVMICVCLMVISSVFVLSACSSPSDIQYPTSTIATNSSPVPTNTLKPTATQTPTETLTPTPSPTPSQTLTATTIPTPIGGKILQIAFIGIDQQGNLNLYTANSSDPEPQPVVSLATGVTKDDGYKYEKISWSPDGQFLLYVNYSMDENIQSINLLNVADGTDKMLLELSGDSAASEFTWVPTQDSSLVLYRDGNDLYWLLDISSGAINRIGNQYDQVKWAEDGLAVYVGGYRWQKINLGDNSAIELPFPKVEGDCCDYFPELDAYLSDNLFMGEASLWFNHEGLLKPLVQIQTQLPNNDCRLAVEQLMVSPNREKLLIQVMDGIYVVDIADLPLIINDPIPSYCENGINIGAIGWTPDGSAYIFVMGQIDRVTEQMISPWVLEIVSFQTGEIIYEYEFPDSLEPLISPIYRSPVKGLDIIWTALP